ncbi:hypothetical protein B0T14DRAFT_309336 [Immersiella caudata]|uniref:Uncharacterized protein n=1 Tax=Immersiella caudata TaxID=314043 RepID=A0AA39WFI4_9PEZI|nr:hypothetical protein B0T14DRAFT_309336 [Immersiella caudata]
METPFLLNDHLVALSRDGALRSKMRSTYAKAVETCLTCLDKGNLDFGDEDEFQDESRAEVGVRYIEKVREIFNGISL